MRTLALAALVLAGSLPAQETQTAALSGAALINHHLKVKWDEAGLKPAKKADDAEFVRRVYLDVAGVIPSLEETEKFLEDKGMYKRQKLVESLCKDPRYAVRWADVWSGVIVGFDNDQRDQAARLKATEDMRDMLAKNIPHDEFARRVITVKGNTVERPGMSKEMEEAKIEDVGLAGYVYNVQREAGKDFPLALVGKLTRAFMGVQIQCAQCHDHPFDKWTQEEFYGMASFFGNVTARRQAFDEKAMMEYMKAQRAEAKPGEKKPAEPVKRPDYYVVVGDRDDATAERAGGRKLGRPGMGGGGDLSIPDGKKGPIKASFLETGKGAVAGEPRRVTFAKYVTSPDNLQFARMQINRVWAHFFGAGIVNPVDDFNAKNKATHPELLDELAKDYIAHKYDNHWLIQAIVNSEAYQLTSRFAGKEKDPQLEKWYAIQRVRALSPEQILRSMVEATGLDETMAKMARLRGPGARPQGRGEMALFQLLNQFRSNFGDDEGNEIVDFAGTIPSALLMMNSREVSGATTAGRAGGLAELISKHPTPDARIRAIFLSTLARTPSDKELARWKGHVAKAGSPAGYEDLSWTLLNTSEFLFNH